MAKFRLYDAHGNSKRDFANVRENDVEVVHENDTVVVTITDYPNGEDEDNVLRAVIFLAPGEWIERISNS